MSFSADWLALREDFDRQARESARPAFDLAALSARLRRPGAPLAVVDLGCGTGANLRHLAPRLGGEQEWTLVDHDAALLAALPASLAVWAERQGWECSQAKEGDGFRIEAADWQARIVPRRVDLAASLAQLPLAAAQLVTASALLDLASARWIDALIGAVPRSTALLFALNVDGRIAWEPALDGDDAVGRLFAAHQLRDKGFGPALGPGAAAHAARRMAEAGRRCLQAESDWRIDAAEGQAALRMLHAMVDGFSVAAPVQSPEAAPLIGAWRAARLRALHKTRLRVGHLDLLA